MDKSLGNMDKRFKNIEAELNYKYDSKMWNSVENLMNNTALDSAFVKAASTSAVVSSLDFSCIDDAFMDDAFVEANESTKAVYESGYYADYKNHESVLFQNDSFVNAATLSSATYQQKYWNDADIALQKEGLHHEYRSDYWKEAEKLLLRDERKGFFLRWGAIATILLLLSILGFNSKGLNEKSYSNTIVNHNKRLSNKVIVNNTVKTNFTEKKEAIIGISENKKSDFKLNGDSKKMTIDESGGFEKNTIDEKNEITKDKVDDLVFEGYDINKKKQNDEFVSISKDLVEKFNRNNKFFINETRPEQNLSLMDIIPNTLKPKHEVGIKLSKGIGTNFSEINTMLSPRNSVFVDYRFSPSKKMNNVQFGLDVGLYHMNLDDFEYEKNYSVYHIAGNVDHYWYKMTYKDLVFVSASFNTYLNLTKESKIRIGLGFDNLVTSRIGMEYKESIDEVPIDAGVEWGVNRGINQIDFNLGVGYELKLNNNFSFIVDSKIGAIDKTNNEYLNINKMDRDMSIQLGLKYKIFTIK